MWSYDDVFILQAKVLTIRDPPYLDILFIAPMKTFDAGDQVDFNLTVINTAGGSSPTSAVDINIKVTLKLLDWYSIRVNCDSGAVLLNSTSQILRVFRNTLAAGDKIFCNITSFLVNHVSPSQRISQEAVVEYYGLPSGKRPVNYASYLEIVHAEVFVTPVNVTFSTSDNAMNLTAGQAFDFKMAMKFPECVTFLQVFVTLPAFLPAPSRRKREWKDHAVVEELSFTLQRRCC